MQQLTAANQRRSTGGPAPAPWYDGLSTGLEGAVRLLALPYANHPDYREEWRP